MNLLEEIAENSKKRVCERFDEKYEAWIGQHLKAAMYRKCLDFPDKKNAIIAEVKIASPAMPPQDINPARLAQKYINAGASAISVVTEPDYFHGSLEILHNLRNISSIPLLQKDFVVDTRQILEGRVMGADGILLIASLQGKHLKNSLKLVDELGMWAVVETRTESEIKEAVKAGARIIGINNRNFKTMKTDLKTSVKLSAFVPKNVKMVCESGIQGAGDIEYLNGKCKRAPDAFLVGTALVQAENAQELLRSLCPGTS